MADDEEEAPPPPPVEMPSQHFFDTVTTVEGHKYKGQLKDAVGKPWVIDGKGTMVYTNGDRYEGEWRLNMRSGNGTMQYKDGTVYEGEWEDDVRSGCGMLTFPNGDAYEGAFRDGHCSGMGTQVVAATFEKFVGLFQADKRHGRGILEFPNGLKYEGNFVAGEIQGDGCMSYPNGDSYTGKFKGGQMHGHGVYRFVNGDVYEGEYRDGRRVGGTLLQSDGQAFEAEFKPSGGLSKLKSVGKDAIELTHDEVKRESVIASGSSTWKEGRGTIKYASGDRFTGDFVRNMRHGYGVMEYETGDVYEGEWSEDKREGRGKMTWRTAGPAPINGWRYDGEWRDDLPGGHGLLLTDLDGGRYEGCWVLGERSGLGTEVVGSCVYEGEFFRNLRQGRGKLTDGDGNVFAGLFEGGRQKDPQGKIAYSNGDTYEGGVIDDHKSGEGILVYANGDRYEGEFRQGMRWGSGEMVFANGDSYEGMWVEDKMSGHGTMVYKGAATYDGGFRADQKHGRGTWRDHATRARFAVVFKNNDLISKDRVGMHGEPI